MKVSSQLFSRSDVDAPHAEAAFLRLLRYRLLHRLTDRAFGHLGKSGIERDDIYAFRNRSNAAPKSGLSRPPVRQSAPPTMYSATCPYHSLNRVKRYFFAFLSAPLNAFSISPRATIASFHTSGKQSSA